MKKFVLSAVAAAFVSTAGATPFVIDNGADFGGNSSTQTSTVDNLGFTGTANRGMSRSRADVVLLNGPETALLTGATGYLGGWLDRRGGTINPLAFTLELARLATEVGVKIATGVRAAANATGFAAERPVIEVRGKCAECQ